MSIRNRGAGVGVFAVAVWLGLVAGAAPPGGKRLGTRLYDPQPLHLWNRLHEEVFVRVGPDGVSYGRDRLEPLLWAHSRHLLEEETCEPVAALLDEFVASHGERLIDDPLKRAVLQRDLWLVFNWLIAHHGNYAEPKLSDEVGRKSQQRLTKSLSAVIGRLALRPEEIRKLPDNYSAAAASGELAKQFDAQRPDEPFLPPDLFSPDGPWVCVTRPDGPVAPMHLLREENPFTNSAFLVFVRLPGGRDATLDYLKRLRAFNEPLLVRERGDASDFLPNPKLPQVPVGAAMALVRRALLIAAPGTVVASPLTESVQLRVFREVPEITPQTIGAAFGGGTEQNRAARAWQASFEFRLSRERLFAGRAGGLVALGAGERDFKTGLGAHPWDEFETRSPSDRSFPELARAVVLDTCFACHSLPGRASFNAYFPFRFTSFAEPARQPPAVLSESSVPDALDAAARWKSGRPDWEALRKMLEAP